MLEGRIVVASVLTIACIALAPIINPPWVLSAFIILLCSVLFFIKWTRFTAIAFMIIAVLYGVGIVPLMVLLGTFAIVVLGEAAYRLSDRQSHSYIFYIIAATAGAGVVMFYLGEWSPMTVVMGVLVALLLKSATEGRYDYLMIDILGVAMTMYLFEELNVSVDSFLLLAAVIIGLSFGYFAYRFKAADLSGLFSGAILGIILIVFADVRWFLIMLTFFVVGSACTRYRFERKQEMGVAESHGGVRGYSNVFANGLASVVAAVLYGISGGHPVFLAFFLGSVSSAAADTVASEIGVVGGTPYLITTFEKVPPGTNGGVTLTGQFVAIMGAASIGIAAFLLNVIDPAWIGICTLAGFVGTNVDSVIGATLENSGRIGNNGTNLIATSSGGVAGVLFFFLFGSVLL